MKRVGFLALLVVAIATLRVLLDGEEPRSMSERAVVPEVDGDLRRDAGPSAVPNRQAVGSAAIEVEALSDSETRPESAEADAQELLFQERYRGASAQAIAGAIADLQVMHDDLRDEAFAARRKSRIVAETLMTQAGAPPKPQDLPAAAYRQTIIGPVEVTDPPGVATVWWISLTREEYPDLYALRDELSWLREMSTSHALTAGEAGR